MQEIKASLILEMIGRPAEHVKETMEKLIDRMGSEKTIKITSRKIAEPKKIESMKREMYSIFAEIEIEIDTLLALFNAMFVYMPSHIEITSPNELKFKNIDLNSVINELVLKLHRYDEVVKRLVVERNILYNQLTKAKQELGIEAKAGEINKIKTSKTKTTKKTGKAEKTKKKSKKK